MSNVRCINFWDLCRICTASSEQKINIYSPDGRAKNLSHKIVECLLVQIDEKDRLPKVVCAQCAQHVEQMYEMRNIAKNSQTILSNWLNHRTPQNDEKVFIKDAINDSGKSLSVLSTASGGLVAGSSGQSNDLLSSIMQAVGMHQQQQQQPQQYTITVDSHVPAHSQPEIKNDKQNTLEEIIRLKPDIKITPLGKKDNVQGTHSNNTMTSIKQQQQQQAAQLQTQTITAVPSAPAQLQLQPLNDLNVLLQQQALWQQIQQLQAQTQTQQQFATCNDDGNGAADSKKPKLNFVISSPATNAQYAGNLPQFGNVGGTQPQIQLQLLPSGNSTTNSMAAQPTQQFNTAALLSSLTGTQVVGGNGASNMLSPNKCFLPITIRDENSDQQIVAHIDTKNLVLPTTYQVQMKLQPQLATPDGQPIMQLTPTSIPATLQLTPQTLGNSASFQTATSTQQNQFFVPQQQHTQQPPQQPQQSQQQHPQQQHSQPQQQQSMPPVAAQVTSQQIIRSPHANTNSQLIIRNVSSEPGTPTSSNTDAAVTFKLPSPRQQQSKFKTPPHNTATVASNAITNTDFTKRLTPVKQQTTVTPSTNVSALQRLSSNTTITKLSKPQAAVPSGNKLPVLNKQNITISRISPMAPPKTDQKAASKPQLQTAPLPTLAQQQLPQTDNGNINILNQRKVNRKPPEQPVNQKPTKIAPQQQILPLATQQQTAVQTQHQQPQQQQQQQQQQLQQQQQRQQQLQVNNTSASDTTAATSVNSLTCPTCQREFKKKEHLTQHVKLHAGLRPFKCTEEGCDKAFSRKEHLSRHLVSHSGQKMFTCEDCKKPFSRKDNLNKHKRTHSAQPSETRLHNCDICNKNFASKQHFEKHREMHKKTRVENTAPSTTMQRTTAVQQTAKDLYEVKQTTTTTTTGQQSQPVQSQIQMPQQQPQIMHVDLDANTITITQAPDSSMQTSLANFVQLGFPQFQNASGSRNQLVCKLEK